MSGLDDTDLLDPARLDAAVAECEPFYEFLTELFEQIASATSSPASPFDRPAAARALKLYLGAVG